MERVIFKNINVVSGFLVYATFALYLFFSFALGKSHHVLSILVALLSLYHSVSGRKVSPVEVSVAVAFFALFFFPVVSLLYSGSHEYVVLLVLGLFFLDAFRILTNISLKSSRGVVFIARDKFASSYKCFWFFSLWCLLGVFIFPSGGHYNYFAFFIPYAFLVLFFEKSMMCGASINNIRKMTVAMFTLIIFYMVFRWGGGGRVFIGALFLMPTLVLIHYYARKLKLWYIYFGAPFILTIGHASRYGANEFTALHDGSVGTPLLITMDLMNRLGTSAEVTRGVGEYFGQVALFLFQWIPRDLWSSKPLGAGLTSVDVLTSRVGVSEGHSTALGVMGESIYFLGSWFLLGAVFLVILYATAILLIKRLSGDYFTPVAIALAFLPNLVWGGMASFGARAWFFIIPVLIYCSISDRRYRSRQKLHVQEQ